jgi:hypothetical protein
VVGLLQITILVYTLIRHNDTCFRQGLEEVGFAQEALVVQVEELEYSQEGVLYAHA